MKPIVSSSISSLNPAWFNNDWIWNGQDWFKYLRPSWTIVLFSSVSDTKSAIVPIVASAMKYSGGWSIKHCDNLYATPAPHKYLNGYSNSGCIGWIMAYAFGNVRPISWWSVTITSTPNACTISISSWPCIPLSTVIISDTPSS